MGGKPRLQKINGQSNLKSDVLKFCCEAIGLDVKAYAGYFDFIDDELVDKRNHVAHGASLRFDENKVAEYRDKVIDLLRITQNEIENAVVMDLYKK